MVFFTTSMNCSAVSPAAWSHAPSKPLVKNTITNGEVADWVAKNVRKSDAEKAAHREAVLNYGKGDDAALRARLQMRKTQGGFGHRDDIQCFVDCIDADEKRI